MDFIRDPDADYITRSFTVQFTSVYQNAKIKDKAKLIKFFAHFFRFWYYSAVAENTVLSPANMIDAMYAKQRGDAYYTPRVDLMYDGASWFELSYLNYEYSPDRHPVVEDLKTFADILNPDASLTKNGFFTAALEQKIYNAISIKDTFYLEYLFQLSANLGLIKRIPSIHANKIQISGNAREFLALPAREILAAAVNETLNICVRFIKNTDPLTEFTVNRYFFESILKKPMPTNEIIRTVYAKAGELLDLNAEAQDGQSDENGGPAPGPEELEQLIMTSSYIFGILLDKYFFTAFGYYLRIIQPLYTRPYDFYTTIEGLNNKNFNDVITGLYMPCNAYTLTRLGTELFAGAAPGLSAGVSKDVPGRLFTAVAESRASGKNCEPDVLTEIGRYHENLLKPAYEIKVTSRGDRRYWKRILAGGDMLLSGLHFYICNEFNMEPPASYAFSAGYADNPFAHYASDNDKSRFKLAAETAIDAMGLEAGEKLFYTAKSEADLIYSEKAEQREVVFILEIIKIKPAGIEFYPQVLKQSQAFNETESSYW